MRFFERVFPFLFWGITAFVLSLFGLQLFVLIKGFSILSSVDFSHGIKPAVEQLWCGKPNCL